MTKLRQFFSYFGGKHQSARYYPGPRDQSMRIVEPFAGSAGYSHLWHWMPVYLFDLDPVICGIWDYLIRVEESEFRCLPINWRHISELPATLPIEARNLMGFWCQRAGTRPGRKAAGWQHSRPDTGWGERQRDILANQLSAIRHWTVRQCSYTELSPLLIDPETTTFIDPPYQRRGGGYVFGSKGINYQHLSDWVGELPGQVIVCEATDADWLPFHYAYQLRTLQNRRGGFVSEALYYQVDGERVKW